MTDLNHYNNYELSLSQNCDGNHKRYNIGLKQLMIYDLIGINVKSYVSLHNYAKIIFNDLEDSSYRIIRIKNGVLENQRAKTFIIWDYPYFCNNSQKFIRPFDHDLFLVLLRKYDFEILIIMTHGETERYNLIKLNPDGKL